MRIATVLVTAIALAAVPGFAQTQPASAGAQQKATVQHQPATPVQLAQQPAATDSLSAGKVDPAQDAAIRHLLDITEQTNLGDHISGAISMQVRSIMGRSLPEERLQKFMLDFDLNLHKKVVPSTILDAVVSVYAQHLSVEDVQGLIRFYESPLGQRIIKVMPQVIQESQNAGAKIVQEAALTTLREMTSEYPELKPLLPSETNSSGAPGPAPTPAPAPAPNPETPNN